MYRILIIVGILAVAAVAGIHLLTVGLRRPRFQDAKTVTRFGLWQRAVHALLAVTFLVLFLTGFGSALSGKPMHGYVLMLHATCAPPFIIALMAMALTWAHDCRYQQHDLTLLQACPLCRTEPVQAGKFNAIQKTFFWLSCLLALPVILSSVLSMFPLVGTAGQHLLLDIHKCTTLLMTVTVLGHAYFQTLGRPGTWQVMTSGKVSSQWADKYAPLWRQKEGA